MLISRPVWVRLLQAVVSVSLLYYLIQLIDWPSVRALVESGVAYKLWPGPVILLIGIGLAAERWRRVLEFFKVSIRRFEALYLYLVGAFYGVALPGVMGGDVVRIAMCRSRTGAGISPILASVTIERGFGLWGVAIIGTFGVFTISPSLRQEIGSYALLISPAIAAGVPLGLLTALFAANHLGRLRFKREYAVRLGALVQHIVTLAKTFPVPLAITTLLLSTAFQASEIFIFYYFGSLLQIDVPISFYLFVAPIVYLSTFLPISLGGVGVREGVLVWFFAMIGVPASNAVLLAFLVYLNRIVVAGIGGCAHILVKPKARVTPTEKEAQSER
jgi:glycosyltransferase 2 family protein